MKTYFINNKAKLKCTRFLLLQSDGDSRYHLFFTIFMGIFHNSSCVISVENAQNIQSHIVNKPTIF